MRFRTEIQPLRMQGTVSHATPLLMLGSCFSDNIGSRLAERLFDVCVNPFGQLYNPQSIASATGLLASGRHFTDDDLFLHDGLWHSFMHHTRFSGSDRGEVLAAINRSLDEARGFMDRARIAALTLGTAKVWTDIASGAVVANCHKLPPQRFATSMLSVDSAAEAIRRAVGSLRSMQPDLQVILTVSPIRHLSDGFHTNALSKATLLLAAEKAASELDRTIYFPAYEALTDDLRDYRFFAPDMVHPSEPAADYIFELFESSFFSPETSEIAKQCLKFARRFSHRPLNAGSDARARDEALHAQARHLAGICPALGRVLDSYQKK